MSGIEQVRVAALGATRGAHLAQRWQEWAGARLAAVCDLRRDAAEAEAAAAALEGSRAPEVFDDPERMLAWGEFDVVIVATPDATHHHLAKQALAAGFHCFVEKPMTTSVADAADLVAAWRASGRTAAVGHEFRHASVVTAARRKIEAGVIGRPRLAVTMDSCGRMGSYWRRREWRASARPPGNSLTLQKGIHQLDIQAFLAGSRPVRVFSSAGADHYGGDKPPDLRCDDCPEAAACIYHADRLTINGNPSRSAAKDRLCVYAADLDIHDNQAVTIDYADGGRGSYVECFFTPDYKVEHTIIGDLGRMVLRYYYGNPYQELETSWIGRTDSERLLCPAVGGHGGGDYNLAREFCRALREGRPAAPDPVEGYYAVALAATIDRSAASGRPEQVPALAEETTP